MAGNFLQAASSTADLTTYTFSSQNLGAADAARHIVVCVESRSANAITISSVTVGGVSASIVAQRTEGSGPSNVSGIAIAAVPSGTSGDVVVTLSAGAVRAAIQMYRLVGFSATAHDTVTGAAAPLTLDIPANGVAIGCGVVSSGSASCVWTGITEDHDANVESQITVSSAHDAFVSAEANRTVRAEFSNITGATSSFASFEPDAGGGAFTLTAESGSYGVTGAAASLEAGRKVTADDGSYAATGVAAILNAGRRVVADSGLYDVTGALATLLAGRLATAQEGSYAITGVAAGLKVDRVLSAGAGVYTVTGADATLTHGQPGAFTITAEAGSYSVSGQDAGLLTGREISAEAGVYSISGTDAALERTRVLIASAGTYSLTGVDASLVLAGRVIVVGPVLWPEGESYAPGFYEGDIF